MNENKEQSGNVLARLEALLFAYGDPISHKKIASCLGIGVDEVPGHITTLKQELERTERGVMITSSGDEVQLVTKPEFADMMQTIMKEEFSENLTPAALETLAIIIYSGPIARSSIDYIRGVNSSFILRALMLRGLVERSTDAKKGNAFVYAPSFDLLKHLGISEKEQMPEFEHLKSVIEKLQNTPQQA